MALIYLNELAHGRSGDKGDTSNVCVFARKPEYYDIIAREATPERVKAYFGDMVFRANHALRRAHAAGFQLRDEARARRRRDPFAKA